MCHNVCSFLLSNNDFFYYDIRQVLTMTVQLTVAFAAFLVEDEDFLAPALVVEHLANYLCTLYVGSTYCYRTLVVNEQYVVEHNLGTFLGVHAVDEQLLAGLYFELLAFHFYNCVHFPIRFLITSCRAAG